MSTIKCKAAVVWEPDGKWMIENVEVSPPGAKEVRIKVQFAGLCHTDLIFTSKGTARRFPLIPGHEGSGIVESIGENVTKVAVGDHVMPNFMPRCHECKYCRHPKTNLCVRGLESSDKGLMVDGTSRFKINGKIAYMFSRYSTFAEYTVVPEEAIAKINPLAPLNKVFYISCGFPAGFGASVNVAKVKPGSTVAVFGAGGVGLAAVFGAKKMGASKLFVVDTNPKKFDIAKKLGATHCLNPRDYDKPINEVLVEMTAGGLDYTIDCTGNSGSMKSAFKSCHNGWGKAILVGLCSENVEIKPMELLFRSWKGCLYGGYSVDDIPDLVEQYMKGDFDLDPYISNEYPLENISEAIEELKAGDVVRNVIRM